MLVAHFLLFGATIVLLGLLVMTTDPCGYQKCGDPAWLDRAMNLNLWAGGAILFADVLVTLIRLVRQRVAWVVPLIGCIAQLAVAFGRCGDGIAGRPGLGRCRWTQRQCHNSHTSLCRLRCSLCPPVSEKFPARLGLSLQGGQTAYRLRAEIGVTDVTPVRPRASLVP